jgi:murein DD-endopeptidase MepM/ murein hydrolase activator NlpD
MAGSAVFLLALIVFLFDYFSMGILRTRYKALSRETAEQKVKIANYEKSLGELQVKVTNFDEYVKKLNIMAGLKSPDVLKGPAGIGGGPSEQESAEPQGTVSPDVSQAVQQGSIQSLSQKAQSIENNFGNLINLFESKGVELASTPSVMPARGWLSSGYGMRIDPFTGQTQMHWGIDISTETGNPIVATADGIVIKALYDKYLGNNVTISHNNGYTTVYGHMSKIAVRAGQKVKRYEVIGYVGQTGKAVGPHVHYEVHKDGKLVNPQKYILEE